MRELEGSSQLRIYHRRIRLVQGLAGAAPSLLTCWRRSMRGREAGRRKAARAGRLPTGWRTGSPEIPHTSSSTTVDEVRRTNKVMSPVGESEIVWGRWV
jgi:hypothetical protein